MSIIPSCKSMKGPKEPSSLKNIRMPKGGLNFLKKDLGNSYDIGLLWEKNDHVIYVPNVSISKFIVDNYHHFSCEVIHHVY